jgi:hypothetical protein
MCRIENIDPLTDRLAPAGAFSFDSPKRRILQSLILMEIVATTGGVVCSWPLGWHRSPEKTVYD